MSDDDDVLDLVVMTSFEVMGRLGQVATRHGLSLTQVRMLAICRDREPSMSELSRFLGLDKSSISGLVDRAAGRDLVRRYADPDDKRSSRIALTGAGSEFVEKVRADASGVLGPLFVRLGERDQSALARLLRQLLGQSESAAQQSGVE